MSKTLQIDWTLAKHDPQMYCPRQKMFYKLSIDKKRLYVLDDDNIWKLSKHDPKSFFEYQSPVYNQNHIDEIIMIQSSNMNPLLVWSKLEIGRIKSLSLFCKISTHAIKNYISNKVKIPIEKLQIISDYTGIDPLYLRKDLQAILDIDLTHKYKTISIAEYNRLKTFEQVYGK